MRTRSSRVRKPDIVDPAALRCCVGLRPATVIAALRASAPGAKPDAPRSRFDSAFLMFDAEANRLDDPRNITEPGHAFAPPPDARSGRTPCPASCGGGVAGWQVWLAGIGAACRSWRLARISWLGWQDSNLRMAVPKTAALPLGYTPARAALYNEPEPNVKGHKHLARHKIAQVGRAAGVSPAACRQSRRQNGVRAVALPRSPTPC